MDVREKLVELIDDFIHNVDVKHWYSEELDEKLADDLITNGVTVQEWIPVTERLPEETKMPKDVLVSHKLGNCGIGVDRAWYDSDKNKWRSVLSMNMKVTHWMPLPDPPQED